MHWKSAILSVPVLRFSRTILTAIAPWKLEKPLPKNQRPHPQFLRFQQTPKTNKIFKINKNIEVLVYENNKIKFEIFITDKKYYKNFDHVCLEIYNKKELIEKCKENNIEYLYVDKDNKKLLFIKDNFGNLFEIK